MPEPALTAETKAPRRSVRVHTGVDDGPQSDTDKLKLALWLIGKLGGSDEADRVFHAALAATRELEKKGVT